MKLLNYGFNVDFLSNQYGDFFIWRSPTEVYKPSPFTNMGREENNFHIDPFINYMAFSDKISNGGPMIRSAPCVLWT